MHHDNTARPGQDHTFRLESGAAATWGCCQLGAREHYSIPRALHRSIKLNCFYTNFWAGPGFRSVANRLSLNSVKRLAERYHKDLCRVAVNSYNWSSILWILDAKKSTRVASIYDSYIRVGASFARKVRDDLKKRCSELPRIFFSYDTSALELFEWLEERGVHRILGQIDANAAHFKILLDEQTYWPGWSTRPLAIPNEYIERRRAEWSKASRIIVNSEFSRSALLNEGVSCDKIDVIPLAFEGDASKSHLLNSEVRRRRTSDPLRILFLGQVTLAKGIQYLIQAAKLLAHAKIEINVVGGIGISEQAIAACPSNIRFHGPVSRGAVGRWLENSDIFVFPTLSDGFGMTQLEAMHAGLPVISTFSCGRVVRSGVDGLVVPARDADALANAILRFYDDADFLSSCSNEARRRVKDFSLGSLAEQLLLLENRLLTNSTRVNGT